jgi:hypothetical protein
MCTMRAHFPRFTMCVLSHAWAPYSTSHPEASIHCPPSFLSVYIPISLICILFHFYFIMDPYFYIHYSVALQLRMTALRRHIWAPAVLTIGGLFGWLNFPPTIYLAEYSRNPFVLHSLICAYMHALSRASRSTRVRSHAFIPCAHLRFLMPCIGQPVSYPIYSRFSSKVPDTRSDQIHTGSIMISFFIHILFI